MRKLWLLCLFFIPCSWFISSCKKNYSEEIYTPVVNPVVPDFATKVNAAVAGFITDENGNAVEGATINGAGITVTADKFGYFKISNAAFAKSAGFVQVTKSGYFAGFRTFLPVQSKENFIRLQLIPKKNVGNINAASGGTVTTTDGAKITLPADAVVIASTNIAYSGTVNVSAHWLNPAETQITNLTMPGNLTGVDSAGHLKVLQTFGMLAVELTGSGGELLQMATGKKASLHFPLPSSLQSIAPPNIPLWYFDETKGVWKQEGNAVKNGSSYEGEVSHFSYWNCDVGLPLVNFTAQFVNTALKPLANAGITISVTNVPFLSRTAYTDTNGVVTGLVPANSNLRIDIDSYCNQDLTVKNIITANEPVDIGIIKADLNQYAGTIEGTVTKCNGGPVTDGYVIVTNLWGNAVVNISNGVFSATGAICPGSNVGIIAIDRETSQQSEVRYITLITGTNNSGVLQACTSFDTEIISVDFSSFDDIVYTLPQHLFGGNFYFGSDSTSINAIDLLNNNQQVVQFRFIGADVPGAHQLSGNRIILGQGPTGQLTFLFTSSVTVSITSYGSVGQFITGSFSGEGTLTGSGQLQNCTVTFNIKRDQ